LVEPQLLRAAAGRRSEWK